MREDIGGDTLSRMTGARTGLTTQQLDDGSIVYSGSAAAEVVAPETGFKEGQELRVLPFGFVYGEAANPEAPLNVALTVGADGTIRSVAVDWGTSDSAWTFTVTYSDLGSTPAIEAPADAVDGARTFAGAHRRPQRVSPIRKEEPREKRKLRWTSTAQHLSSP